MSQAEIRRSVAERLVRALEQGTPPWRRPWSPMDNTGSPANVVSRRPYRGINSLLLGLAAAERGYRSRWWATFNQWRALGCGVRERPAGVPPGGWGSRTILFKPVSKAVTAEAGEEERVEFCLLRQFTVFNAEQVEGAEEHLARPRPGPAVPDFAPAEAAIRATGADIRCGGGRAFYRPAEDVIRLPERSSFSSQAAYYSAAFHELAHWTGHESRLGRLVKHARFGDAAYAVEELVAEVGGCFLAAELNVPQAADLSNQAAYLGAWLRVLKADPRTVFTVAAQAGAAADYVLRFSRPRAAGGADPARAA